MKKRIAIDQDQVMADIMSPWLDKYNDEYGDSLKPQDITQWNWHGITHADCQEKIYTYLDDPDLFLNLPVMEGSQEVIEELNHMYDVFIVTAAFNPLNIPSKYQWLKKHFPFLDEEKFVFTRDKSVILADYLIDDKPKNLETFQGNQILYSAPHNLKEDRFYRVNNWEDVRETLLDWK